MTESLKRIFLTNTGRTINKMEHYFPVYERHFGRLIGQKLTMIEIGAGHGGSPAMWKRWLGPDATIISLDYRDECKEIEEPQIHVRIGDQADRPFLARVVAEFGFPDIVIDDGSHRGDDQWASFSFLYPVLKPTGIYMVEDLMVSYIQDHEGTPGGVGCPSTFIETTKRLIDSLHADWQRPEPDWFTTPGVDIPFTRQTFGIHIYDSMAVIEKGAVPWDRKRVIWSPALSSGVKRHWTRLERDK